MARVSASNSTSDGSSARHLFSGQSTAGLAGIDQSDNMAGPETFELPTLRFEAYPGIASPNHR